MGGYSSGRLQWEATGGRYHPLQLQTYSWEAGGPQWGATGGRYHPLELQTYSWEVGGLQLAHSSGKHVRGRLGGYTGRLPPPASLPP